jgi:3-oxoacyl-[acyl-carrier protein] reductase
MKEFKGKTVIVTGATRGIGRTIAGLFVSLGADVIATGTKPGKSGQWHLDLCDDKSVDVFCEKVSKLPKIDILINNAGINKIESVEAVTNEAWEKILKVNLTGAMKITRAVSRVMIKKQKGGRIVNVSSIYGVVSRAKRNAYSASKAGLIGLTRSSALDLAPHGILVNALCPGFVLTDLTKSILSSQDIKSLSNDVPLKRFGTEKEIAQAAVFLCWDKNSYMTGQTFMADGGFTAK